MGRLETLLDRYERLRRRREELRTESLRVEADINMTLDQIRVSKAQAKLKAKSVRRPSLAKARETVQDNNVGDGATRTIKGRRQFWWRGAWRDC